MEITDLVKTIYLLTSTCPNPLTSPNNSKETISREDLEWPQDEQKKEKSKEEDE